MDRIRILGLLALAAGLSLVGCGPTRGASLSPDARVVAYNDGDAVVLHSFVDRRADRRIPIKEAGAPSFSPDGKWIVVTATKKTYLLNGLGEQVAMLPDVDLPIAWNPDSSEFVGCRHYDAVVVHIASKSVVRMYSLPIQPLQATWMGPGRNMAFCSSNTIVTVVGGRVFQKELDASNLKIGFDSVEGRLSWVASAKADNHKLVLSKLKFPVGLPIKVSSSNEELSDIHGTGVDIAADIPQLSEPKLISVTSDSASPNGKYVALSLIFDASPPGLLHRYFELQDIESNLHGTDKVHQKLRQEMDGISRQIKLRSEFVVKPVGSESTSARTVYISENGSIPMYVRWPILAWAPDSSSIAVVSGDRVMKQEVWIKP